MTVVPGAQVWTLRLEGIDESTVEKWREVLNTTERERADRFVFARHRLEFTAAHALVRFALSCIMLDAHLMRWRLVAGKNGKPVAYLGEQPAPLSFNLSHTDGLVGVAAVPRPGHAVGFDLEALDRKVTLDIADRYFRAEEITWLRSLPAAARSEGFLRLWTLKEAFIKATGEGLSQDLAAFWFSPLPPRIHFTAALPERAEDWHFEQRLVAERFVAAVGLCRKDGVAPSPACWTPACWTEVVPNHGGDQSLFRTVS
jgi:4'-phosphopantetheinyl transferase